MAYNPATVGNLVRLMLGGLPPKHQGEVLQARVRYFDPIKRRPGLPEDVAALVDSLTDDSTSLTLANLNERRNKKLAQAQPYSGSAYSFTRVVAIHRWLAGDRADAGDSHTVRPDSLVAAR